MKLSGKTFIGGDNWPNVEYLIEAGQVGQGKGLVKISSVAVAYGGWQYCLHDSLAS